MAVLEVVKYGNPILRKKCSMVTDFSKLSDFIDNMFYTMYEEEGIGLAANQVGVGMNLFVIDISHTDENEFPRIFVNGEIISSDDESIFSEGCLSIPQVALEVKRPENIVFKYQDIREKWHEEEFDGLLARAIQHEIDHLNGVLIIDLVSEMQRVRVNQEIKKIKKHSEAKLKQQSITKRFVL
jgi:peptide deformylase